MIVVRSEDTNFFDIDGTLVLPITSKHGKKIKILDPVTKGYITLRIHAPMVRLLREAHQRGSYIVVWSRGGWEWARNVIEALNLTKEVNQIMTKPLVYFDDVPAKEWLAYRVYLEPGTHYKDEITPNRQTKES